MDVAGALWGGLVVLGGAALIAIGVGAATSGLDKVQRDIGISLPKIGA